MFSENTDNSKRHDFFNGKSKTVSPDTAVKRLKNIACDPIPEDASKTFKEISQHRNRVIHFVHGISDNEAEASAELERVAAEQCLGWSHLHCLLDEIWKEHFKDFTNEILQLEFRMQRHRQYLEAKFKKKKDEIDIHLAKGGKVRTCYSCKYDSVLVSDLGGTGGVQYWHLFRLISSCSI